MASISCNSGSYTIIGAVSFAAFALGVAVGSYGVTGTAAGVVYGHPITAVSGSYSLTGQLISISRISAAPGSYQVQGQTATLTTSQATRVVSATSGSYSVSGVVAGLIQSKPYPRGEYALTGVAATLTPSGNPRLAVTPGSYSATGGTTVLEHIRLIGTGDYNITGTTASLTKGKGLVANSRTFAITGIPAILKQTRTFPLGIGSYSITGDITTLRASNDAAKVLVLDRGLYTLSGTLAGLPIIMPADEGSYTVSGQFAGLIPQVSPGSYQINGFPVTFNLSREAATGSYSITGNPNTTLRGPGPTVIATPGLYILFGFQANPVTSRILQQDSGVYSIISPDLTLRATHLDAMSGQYTLTGASTTLLQTTQTRRWRKQPKQVASTVKQPIPIDTWDPQSGSPGV